MKRFSSTHTPGLTSFSILLVLWLATPVKASAGVGFGTQKDYPAGTGPVAAVVADFNGDGKRDLAVANSGSGDISLLLGNDDGTFQLPLNFNVGTNPVALVAADFNRDGAPDLAVATLDVVSGVGTVTVLLGNGDGRFQAASVILTQPGAHAVAAGDLNGDDKPDLAISALDGTGMVTVILGNGDGTFQAPVKYSFARQPQYQGLKRDGTSVVIADFNNDKKQDLVVTSAIYGCDVLPEIFCGEVSVLLGDGDGTFQPSIDNDVDAATGSASPADLDGDGRLDLALTLRPSVFVISAGVVLGNGDGTFQVPQSLDSGVPQDFQMRTADVDGDGIPDLVALRCCGLLRAFVGNGDSTFQAPEDFVLNGHPSADGEVAIGNFNGDNLPDVAVPLIAENSVAVLLNTSAAKGADLAVAISFFGGNASHSLVSNNRGPHDATGVTITDVLPAAVTIVSVTPSQGSCNGTSVLVCDLGSLAAGRIARVDIEVTSTASGTFAYSATVTADQSDPDSSNNTDTQSFTIFPLTVAKAGSGSGFVTDGNGHIDCGSHCTESFFAGTVVALSQFADAGSIFAGWGGACSGTSDCNVTMNSDQTVTATFNLATPDFALSASAPIPNPINPGQSSIVTLTADPVAGFSSSVSLTCSVQPSPSQAPRCSLNPNSITPGTTATLTITTTSPTAVQARLFESASHSFNALWLPMAGLALAGISFSSLRKKKTKLAAFLLCSLLVAGLVFQSACGGGGGGNGGGGGTPTGTYTITITGTSGSLQHSTTVTLKVQ